MNDEQSKALVAGYGITDPRPVIAKYNKADSQFKKIADLMIYECQEQVKNRIRREQAERFLASHDKK